MSLLNTLGLPPPSTRRGAASPQASASVRTTAPAPRPLTIVTASGATQLLAGASERLRVTATLPNGASKDITGEVSWKSSDAGVVISPSGYTEVKAAAGRVTLSATHAATGATGTIAVTVVARILRKITIGPRNPMFEVDRFEPLRATGEFSDGGVEDITAKVIWESRDEKVARMESDGHCHTRAPGKADIWASDLDAGVIDTTRVTVSATGKAPKLVRLHVTPVDPVLSGFAPLQFTATGDFADRSAHEVTDGVRWVSTKPDVLAINERTGLATPGLVAGTAWITAVDDATSVYARSEVTVEVPKLESIAIAPRDLSLHKGEGVAISVMGAFSNRTTRDVTAQVTWSTSDRAVAAVDRVLQQILGASEGPLVEIGAALPGFPDVGDFITVTVLPAVADPSP